MIEYIGLTLSYPLRLMATWLAVGVLKIFGVPVSAERTLITLDSGTAQIAVTDACGGLEQLGGLVAVGLLFAWLMQKGWGWRILHWTTILPCVVLANAMRLIVTVLLVRAYGDVILGDAWHISLGWAQTVLAVVLLWLFGKAIAYGAQKK
ncbi:MAG: exosortase/archaeosortase family protein [Kiritimatiellae bacterium]|jgi:exosortase|nr:exosortase/archaeosortase family protein [Kiritimatiellia bacterium]